MAGRIVSCYDLQNPYSQYAVMSRDWSLEGAGKGDGILSQDELRQVIRQQERKFQATSTSADWSALDESRKLLRDMEQANVEAVYYLPEELRTVVPEHLKGRATELLMLSYDPQVDTRGTITQEVVDRARNNYRSLPGSVWATMNSRQKGIDEISELANLLGLH